MAQENTVDYAAVLADLESRKAKIEAMITAVKEFLGESRTIMAGTGELRINGDDRIPANFFAHMGISDAAEKYLKHAGQLKNTGEVMVALQRGGFVSASQDFRKTLSTIMNQKARDPESDLVKWQGRWGLASWSQSMRRIKNGNVAGSTHDSQEEGVAIGDPLEE